MAANRPDPDLAHCKGCGKAILWVINENGRREPFDAKPSRVLKLAGEDEPDGTLFASFATRDNEDVSWQIQTGHLPHFVTCPNAGQFRKGAKRK